MRLYCIGLVLAAISCGQSGNDKSINTNVSGKQVRLSDTLSEDYLTRTVFSIDEVKEKSRFIDSVSNHQDHLSILIDKPDGDESDYHLRIGYNGELRFETFYHFYINPLTKELTIEDVYSGDRISLEQWRQKK